MPDTHNCPTGYRWDSTTNKCVPATGTVDPIKPSIASTKKTTKKKK